MPQKQKLGLGKKAKIVEMTQSMSPFCATYLTLSYFIT